MDVWENVPTSILMMVLVLQDNATFNVHVNVYLHVLDLTQQLMEVFLQLKELRQKQFEQIIFLMQYFC